MAKSNHKSGREKSMSKKAPAISKMSSSKKLSRMGKRRKSGEAGMAGSYISRSVVLRRLQLTMKDFRRLCILKGVYPREVVSKKKNLDAHQSTYYHAKDVQALSSEPLVAKFREFKTFMKRVRRLVGRKDVANARKKHEQMPTYVLHHLVKERYPRFKDAANDLDDALSTLFLFAALPSEGRVSSERVAKCEELCQRWNAYVSVTGTLQKVFVSVKGIYFSATINKDVVVNWLVPHAFSHDLPSKRQVDYRVMLTFLEFYEILIKFVLFKLYRDDAPLFTSTQKDDAAQEEEEKRLFTGLSFCLAPEARYAWLDFVIRSGGGKVVASSDDTHTHLVTDRTPGPQSSAEKVQPQWIVDSFNNKRLLSVARYAPGAELPPHLSPFVDDASYVPAYEEELKKSAFSDFRALENKDTPVVMAEEEETATKKNNEDLAKIMMSKKVKRLHGRMLHGIQQKKDKVDRLKARRARLEEQKASSSPQE